MEFEIISRRCQAEMVLYIAWDVEY